MFTSILNFVAYNISMSPKNLGSITSIIVICIAAVSVVTVGAYVMGGLLRSNRLPDRKFPPPRQPSQNQIPQNERQRDKNVHPTLTSTIPPKITTPDITNTPTKSPDAASTLSTPSKVATSDGKHYFYYGYPSGQNNKQTKKIIFSLPGHGSTAEQDYSAWKPQLTENGTYALASLNWWDGKGEAPTNYYSPVEVLKQIREFLSAQGYSASDLVVLEGFSRGSANTYSVKANDIISGNPVIDAVISASGKYQSDFAMTDEMLNFNNGKLYSAVPWVLACGEKDDNPTRDGCIGMNETKTFLLSKGANVLGVLSDPNGGHGSFHQSPLKLAVQALSLIDTYADK